MNNLEHRTELMIMHLMIKDVTFIIPRLFAHSISNFLCALKQLNIPLQVWTPHRGCIFKMWME